MDNPFLKALDVLRERGWHQGWYEGPGGAVCSLGALHVAVVGKACVHACMPSDVLVGLAQLESLLLNVAAPGTNIPFWNDAPERSYEDVVLAFKHAAEKWEESHD